MNIDWSKAPEWATKHGFVSPEMLPVWLNTHQYRYVDERQSGRSFSLINKEGYTIDQVMNISLRPVVSGWNGEGLPPVGMVCEIHHTCWGCDDWQVCTVKYISSEYLIVDEGAFKCEQHFHMSDMNFRPIRTAEQIAADDREKAINFMMGDGGVDDKEWSRMFCAALYDAGYRKQVTE